MKKIVLVIYIIGCSFVSFAQVKIGLRVGSGLGLTSVQDKNSLDLIDHSKGAASGSFTVGPTFDFFLTDNLAFSTGLWWSTRRIAIKSDVLTISSKNTATLQYVQLPATFKVYTNEVTSGLKVYAQLGGLVEAKISDKLKSSDPNLTSTSGYDYEGRYQYINLGIYSGAGVQYA